MYWFDVLDVLEDASEALTSFEIYECLVEENGSANLNNVRRALKQLADADNVVVEERMVENAGRGQHRKHFYRFNKNI